MAIRYVTVAEVNSLLGTSGEDTLITSLIEGAESLFDSLIGSDTGLLTSSKTEYFEVNDLSKPYLLRDRVFDLGTYKPTAITTINGVSPGTVNVDYTITRQRLEFKLPQISPNTFPYRFAIVYTSGYADIAAIPNDVKTAVKYIVGALYNTKNAQGIASFRQDLLSVNYKDGSVLDTILDGNQKNFIQAVIQSYSVYSVIS